MRRLITFSSGIWLCALCAAAPDSVPDAGTLTLEDPVPVEDRTLGLDESATIPLPPFPSRAGRVVALRFRAVSWTETPAGCNLNATVLVNGTPLGRNTDAGSERLLGRQPQFSFKERYEGSFSVFSGQRLMIMFAPDADAGDSMTGDGLGATFLLDVSDLVRGVDGNTITFRNTRQPSHLGNNNNLLITDVQIGWINRSDLPNPPSLRPERGTIAERTAADDPVVEQASGGGFAVAMASGARLRVETGLDLAWDAPSDLIAEDTGVPRPEQLAVERFGTAGFRVHYTWHSLSLNRTIEVCDRNVVWRERWTNRGDSTAGVPLRHRVFLDTPGARIVLGGDADALELAGSPQNPTVFLEAAGNSGSGFGITVESDWLRLLMGIRARGGVADITSRTLALPPGGTFDAELIITPISDGGGYWSFINRVRERWGANGWRMPAPVFWGFRRVTDAPDADECVRRSLAHLGPIIVGVGPWVRLGYDSSVVRKGRYPKLAENAPPAPGGTPDLDIDAFLAMDHREPYWKQLRLDTERIHRTCPDAQVMKLMHPAMEVAYKPLAQRWPYAQDAIITPQGLPFESASYSRAHLGNWTDKGWGVLYYVPRPSSNYLHALLRDVRRALDEAGCDGIYFDEFSWAGTRRGYSRYDYSRWDGYSADFDAEGNVLRLKTDNAKITESAQLQIAHCVLSRDRFFLGNGTGVLQSVSRLPVARFVEGGNGYGAWSGAHLAKTPLILGNFGKQDTLKGVFDSVKRCLSNGCIYSPTGVNLLLEGADNVVCKLYPITIRQIGPGTVVGDERFITTEPQQTGWPHETADITVFTYDAAGVLQRPPAQIQARAGVPLRLDVPPGGLIIAERGTGKG